MLAKESVKSRLGKTIDSNGNEINQTHMTKENPP
jgi:hypothetical protein